MDRADQAEGPRVAERIDPGRPGIGNHRHLTVGPGVRAKGPRQIEHQTMAEVLRLQEVRVQGQLLPAPPQIADLQVEQFDAFLLDPMKKHQGGERHGVADP